MKKISDGLCIAHKGLIKVSGTRKSAFKPFRGVILWKKLFQKAYAREVLVEADSVPSSPVTFHRNFSKNGMALKIFLDKVVKGWTPFPRREGEMSPFWWTQLDITWVWGVRGGQNFFCYGLWTHWDPLGVRPAPKSICTHQAHPLKLLPPKNG